jgi:hypothetical protein
MEGLQFTSVGIGMGIMEPFQGANGRLAGRVKPCPVWQFNLPDEALRDRTLDSLQWKVSRRLPLACRCKPAWKGYCKGFARGE